MVFLGVVGKNGLSFSKLTLVTEVSMIKFSSFLFSKLLVCSTFKPKKKISEYKNCLEDGISCVLEKLC